MYKIIDCIVCAHVCVCVPKCRETVQFYSVLNEFYRFDLVFYESNHAIIFCSFINFCKLFPIENGKNIQYSGRHITAFMLGKIALL